MRYLLLSTMALILTCHAVNAQKDSTGGSRINKILRKADTLLKKVDETDCCKGTTWGDRTYTLNKAIKPLSAQSESNLGTYRCNEKADFKVCYNCAPGCDKATIEYQVYRYGTMNFISSNSVSSCANYSVAMPSTAGYYGININAYCGGKLCKALTYYFNVECPIVDSVNCCKNATQKPPVIINAAGDKLLDLNCAVPKVYLNGKLCNQDLYVKASSNCGSTDSNCSSKAVITLKNSPLTVNITSNNILIIPATIADGIYDLTITYYCGGQVCKTCKFELIKKCVASPSCCNESKWGTNKILNYHILTELPECGKSIGTFKCGEKKSFQFCFTCPANCGNPGLQYEIFKASGGTPVSSGSLPHCTLTPITMPTVNGAYYIVITPTCNGIKCTPCRYDFKVECAEPVDCCKGGSWKTKTISWESRIYYPEALPVEKQTIPIKGKIPKPGGPKDPVPPQQTSYNIKCDTTYSLSQNTVYNFNADYNCAAGNCPKKVMVKITGVNNTSMNGIFLAPVSKIFAQAGNYRITYYAYCGDNVCDSCTYTINIKQDCCAGTRWKKAQYLIVNKRADGSWDYSDQTYYNLPLSISPNGIPTIRADVGITVDNLDYECPDISGCSASYIIRRKNLTTGVFEPDEILTNGKDDASVYARTYPQMIWIIPECGGQRCGVPVIFRIECLNMDCDPCKGKKVLNINTGISANGSRIAANTADPYWITAYSRNTVQSGWTSNTTSQKLTPVLNSNTATGNFNFTRTFYVCQSGNIEINGRVLCDNKLLSLQLLDPTSAVLWSAPSLPTTNDNIVPPGGTYNFSVTIPLSSGQYRLIATYRNRPSSLGLATDGWFELIGTISTTNGQIVNTIQECCSATPASPTTSYGPAGQLNGLNLQNAQPLDYNNETVKICDQVWMTKNLDVTTYRNGDPIPQVVNTAQWANLTTGAWCYYNNDPAIGAIYGRLYNWYAVNDPRGLAPVGWHIPADAEWTTLINCLGGDQIAGLKCRRPAYCIGPAPIHKQQIAAGLQAFLEGNLILMELL